MDSTSQQQHGRKRRLVLCFDGTGNKFLGNESDTNIVKIYELLKRDDPNQFHYYQRKRCPLFTLYTSSQSIYDYFSYVPWNNTNIMIAGIGTYVENQSGNSSSGSLWTRIKSSLVTTIDQAIGTSFVNHVLAGYRFIMRYYNEGDLIYIFGFSRGAYTARFLAEMLFSVGLLSRGNEEMVRFAWNTFSDFQCSRYNEPKSKKDIDRIEYMKKFKDTFCRENVGVHFLGLFDCVNSVGQFEIPLMRKSYKYIASPPAKYIRHAISIHERRLKFKPALFLMDNLEPVHGVDTENSDVRECWFAGNHGDVGGGWGLGKRQRQLLSDTPLEWMLGELQTVPKDEQLAIAKWSAAQDSASITKYSTEPCETVDRNQPSNFEIRRTTNQPHDMLAFGKGATWFQTLQWWIIGTLIPTHYYFSHCCKPLL